MDVSDCYWFDPEKGCCNTEIYMPDDDPFKNSWHGCIGFSKCSKCSSGIEQPPTELLYKHDAVNHPDHYTQGGVECIDAIRAALGPDGFQASCAANVIKYVWRYRNKNGLEDLRKAQVYLGWLIESIEEEVNGER